MCWSTPWANCPKTCSLSLTTLRQKSCLPATSSTTKASVLTSAHAAALFTCLWHSIHRTLKLSTQWLKVQCAPAWTDVPTLWANKYCPCWCTAMQLLRVKVSTKKHWLWRKPVVTPQAVPFTSSSTIKLVSPHQILATWVLRCTAPTSSRWWKHLCCTSTQTIQKQRCWPCKLRSSTA